MPQQGRLTSAGAFIGLAVVEPGQHPLGILPGGDLRAPGGVDFAVGSQVFQHQGYLAGKAPVTDCLDGKFIFNIKLNYELARGLSVYFNARNLLDAEAREFAFCDRIEGVYLVGISYQY